MKFIPFAFLYRNFWYKLSSLLLAILIWGIVQGEEILEINRKIKINFSVANGYMVKGKSSMDIDARVRGPRVLLGEFGTRPIEAKIYIPKAQTGKLEIPFDKNYLKNWDDRIKVTPRDPYITVYVDEKVERSIPVREVLKGAPGEGYIIEKIAITPDKVSVTGPKSEIAKMHEIITEPIDISGLKQSKTVDVRLDVKDLGLDEISHEEVKVNLQMGDSKINQRFSQIRLDIVGSEYKASVKPSYVSIVIQGTPTVLGLVTKNDLRAFIEVASLGPGSYEKDIQVKIPSNTVLIETLPKKGTVTIENKTK